MARDILQELFENDPERVQPSGRTGGFLDPGIEESILEAGAAIGIPIVELSESQQAADTIEELFSTQYASAKGPALPLPPPPEAQPDAFVMEGVSTSDAPWPQAEEISKVIDAHRDVELTPAKAGIEIKALEEKVLAEDAPDFEDLASEEEDNLGFIPLGNDVTEEERVLINYHRHMIKNNLQLDDEQGRTTVYITGVQGPDGREYLIPGYFNGKRQDPETASVRASLVGWRNYPSYRDPYEAQKAVEKIKGYIDRDDPTRVESDGTILNPVPTMAAQQAPTGAPIPPRKPQASERTRRSMRKAYTARFEGGHFPRVYEDSLGVPTIGIGFNLDRDDAPAVMESLGLDYEALLSGEAELSFEDSQRLFEMEFSRAEAIAAKFVDKFEELSPARQEVLIDMAYNLGQTRLRKFVEFRASLNAGDYVRAANEMIKSRWYHQVGRRSRALVTQMLEG
jgi:GH24 family phage-related lysozyme (muramidase)